MITAIDKTYYILADLIKYRIDALLTLPPKMSDLNSRPV